MDIIKKFHRVSSTLILSENYTIEERNASKVKSLPENQMRKVWVEAPSRI